MLSGVEKIRKAEEGAKANMSETEHEITPNHEDITEKSMCVPLHIIIRWFGSWNKIWMDYGCKSSGLIGFLIHIPIIKFIHTHTLRVIYIKFQYRDKDIWFWMR